MTVDCITKKDFKKHHFKGQYRSLNSKNNLFELINESKSESELKLKTQTEFFFVPMYGYNEGIRRLISGFNFDTRFSSVLFFGSVKRLIKTNT